MRHPQAPCISPRLALPYSHCQCKRQAAHHFVSFARDTQGAHIGTKSLVFTELLFPNFAMCHLPGLKPCNAGKVSERNSIVSCSNWHRMSGLLSCRALRLPAVPQCLWLCVPTGGSCGQHCWQCHWHRASTHHYPTALDGISVSLLLSVNPFSNTFFICIPTAFATGGGKALPIMRQAAVFFVPKSQSSGKPCRRASIRGVSRGKPSKPGSGASVATPRPSMPSSAHACRALVGPRSGPPCFLLPPTSVGAMRLALSRHAPAFSQPRAAMRSWRVLPRSVLD